jgi:hypothetical protein
LTDLVLLFAAATELVTNPTKVSRTAVILASTTVAPASSATRSFFAADPGLVGGGRRGEQIVGVLTFGVGGGQQRLGRAVSARHRLLGGLSCARGR